MLLWHHVQSLLDGLLSLLLEHLLHVPLGARRILHDDLTRCENFLVFVYRT